MQHSEEVRAGEELGAWGLKQQSEAGPGTAGLSHAVVPTQLCNTHIRAVVRKRAPKANAVQWRRDVGSTWDGGVGVSLIYWQLIGRLILWSAIVGYGPSYALIPRKALVLKGYPSIKVKTCVFAC